MDIYFTKVTISLAGIVDNIVDYFFSCEEVFQYDGKLRSSRMRTMVVGAFFFSSELSVDRFVYVISWLKLISFGIGRMYLYVSFCNNIIYSELSYGYFIVTYKRADSYLGST